MTRSRKRRSEEVTDDEKLYHQQTVQFPPPPYHPTCTDWMLPQKFLCSGCQRAGERVSSLFSSSTSSPFNDPNASHYIRMNVSRTGRAKCNQQDRTGTEAFVKAFRAPIYQEDEDLQDEDEGHVTVAETTVVAAEQDLIEPGSNEQQTAPYELVNKACQGWRDKALLPLVTQSLKEYMQQQDTEDMPSIPNVFPLTMLYQNYKHYNEIVVCKEVTEATYGEAVAKDVFVIRSRACCGDMLLSRPQLHQKYCFRCQVVGDAVGRIARDCNHCSNPNEEAFLNPRHVAFGSPNTVRNVFNQKTEKLHEELKSMKKENDTLKRRLNMTIETVPDNQDIVCNILTSALPLMEENIRSRASRANSERPEEVHKVKRKIETLRHIVKMTTETRDPRGFRYSDEMIEYGLFLLGRCDKGTYDDLANRLWLPSRRHLMKVRRQKVTDYSDGPCFLAIATSKEKLKEFMQKSPNNKNANKLIISFDSMKMRKSMMISTREGSEGRFVGCVLHDDETFLARQFDSFLNKAQLARAVLGNTEECDKMIDESLVENTEHMVFYASAVAPEFEHRFLCAKYNMASIKAADIYSQVLEVAHALGEAGFKIFAFTSDSAQANESFASRLLDTPASAFIPRELLTGNGTQRVLDGGFPVAASTLLVAPRDESIYVFGTSDYVHVIKRVANDMSNRERLSYGEDSNGNLRPLSLGFLKECRTAYQESGKGSLVSLNGLLKLTDDLFEKANCYNKMRYFFSSNKRDRQLTDRFVSPATCSLNAINSISTTSFTKSLMTPPLSALKKKVVNVSRKTSLNRPSEM